MIDMIIPYVGMDRVIDLLNILCKEKTREIEASDVAAIKGTSISNIENAIYTLKLLGFVEYQKKVILLTEQGMTFINSITSGKDDQAKQILRSVIERNEVLSFVKSLLESRSQLTGEEIGRAISERFNRKWKSLATYRNYGNSCASILGFAGIGFYQDGILSVKPLTMKAEMELYAPEVGFKPILKILRGLHSFRRARSSEIAKKLEIKKSRLGSELAICVTLGLIEKDATGSYRITNRGSALINPTLTKEEKMRTFRECLINSPYADLIEKFTVAFKEFNHQDVGEYLSFELRRDWTPMTKEIYGKKFLTWLKAAGLVKKISSNKYSVLAKEVSTLTKKAERKELREKIRSDQIFELGRMFGVLETLADEDRKELFENSLSVLKSMLKDHKELEVAIDMLPKNFELSLLHKDPSIYRSSINLIRQKVKEKLEIED
jgi:hypothetical protein